MIEEIKQMARDGIPRHTIKLKTGLSREAIDQILKGITQHTQERTPDPTPEEILERRREITPWMTLPDKNYYD